MSPKRAVLGVLALAGAVIVAVIAVSYAVRARTDDANALVSIPGAGRYHRQDEDFERAGQRYADVSAAAAVLTFRPRTLQDMQGRRLVRVYAAPLRSARRDGTKTERLPAGMSNYLVLVYEGGFRIQEKAWDPEVVPDEATFGRELTAGFENDPRMAQRLKTARVSGVTVWYWDKFTLPEEVGEDGAVRAPGVVVSSSQASWFQDGVSITIGSTEMPGEDLLAFARAMIEQ
ncbi:hypothetical protein MX659_06390 [Coriobacteriia bacterium Es71-Z0120]|uniref:hypothetical protein n=1 Tax=Parvivirga hydrogeniphila TaxID=2939460 RepID=UPI002260A947|nr:hypothetical protein [Parvivirga hydrogeniphila]MCL4079214.1 hypothetical protein [Parvivirga hydrogeniphila]